MPELKRLGLLTMVDVTALAAYCQSYRRWLQAESDLDNLGIVLTNKTGYRVANPAVGISERERNLMKAFLVEFGLTPSSRSRLHVDADKPETDEDRFFGTG